MSTKVYGASDDLIEFEGDVDGEVGHYSERPVKVTMSDGTVLSVQFDEEGVWRILAKTVGPLLDRIDRIGVDLVFDSEDYSDVAHFKDGLIGARCKGRAVR